MITKKKKKTLKLQTQAVAAYFLQSFLKCNYTLFTQRRICTLYAKTYNDVHGIQPMRH